MRNNKVVQTEVDQATHARLQHLAAKRDIPLKRLVREALSRYVEKEEGALESDPIRRLVGSLDLRAKDWSTRKDWRP
jgi:hypothetical protein